MTLCLSPGLQYSTDITLARGCLPASLVPACRFSNYLLAPYSIAQREVCGMEPDFMSILLIVEILLFVQSLRSGNPPDLSPTLEPLAG